MKGAGYIILKIRVVDEDGRLVAYCDELGVSAFAKSLNDLHERMQDLIKCHLNALEIAGIRDRVFKENGIRFYISRPEQKDISITTPLNRNNYVQAYVQPIPAHS